MIFARHYYLLIHFNFDTAIIFHRVEHLTSKPRLASLHWIRFTRVHLQSHVLCM